MVDGQDWTLRVPSPADLAAGACLRVYELRYGREKFLLRLLADLAVVVGPGTIIWMEVEAHMPPEPVGGAR